MTQAKTWSGWGRQMQHKKYFFALSFEIWPFSYYVFKDIKENILNRFFFLNLIDLVIVLSKYLLVCYNCAKYGHDSNMERWLSRLKLGTFENIR